VNTSVNLSVQKMEQPGYSKKTYLDFKIDLNISLEQKKLNRGQTLGFV